MLMVMWSAAKSLWAEPASRNPSAGIARRDRVFAVIVLVVVGVEAFTRFDGGWRPAVMGLGVALAAATLVRRAHCLTAVLIGFGAFLAFDVVAVVLDAGTVSLYSGVSVLMLVYSLFRRGAGRDVVLGTVVVAAEFVVSSITDFSGFGDASGGAAMLLFVAALATAARYRMMARDQLVEQVKLHERERLARELHDVVGHHVSAIAVQAQAGLILARSSPTAVTEVLATIDREAARTLEEMRVMLGLLRDRSQATYSVHKGVGDIERLASVGTDSLRVDVEVRGDLSGLPKAVETAFFRVAREAVTNAQRHAQCATRVQVTVIGDVTELQLLVSDDGARVSPSRTQGFGLIGMTERFVLLGGSFESGPGIDRGWHVRATLPRPRPVAI